MEKALPFNSGMVGGVGQGTGAVVDAPPLHDVGNAIVVEFAEFAEEAGQRVGMDQVFFADPVGFAAHDIDEAVLVLALHLNALAIVVVLYDKSEVGHSIFPHRIAR